MTGFQRFFAFGGTRAAGERAAAQLVAYRQRYLANSMSDRITRLAPLDNARRRHVRIEDALADWLRLPRRLGESSPFVSLAPSPTFAILPSAMKALKRAITEEPELRAAAANAAEELISGESLALLVDVPVEDLRKASTERIPTSALRNLGLETVHGVLLEVDDLHLYQGLSEDSAGRILEAAAVIWKSKEDEIQIRFDVDEKPEEHTKLLRCLREWEACRTTTRSPDELALIQALVPLADTIYHDVSHVLIFCSSAASVDDFVESIQVVRRCARRLLDARDEAASGNVWKDFLSRPADYYSMLAELGFVTEDEAKAQGHLPADILEKVRAQELQTEYLNVPLRDYQSFGARFALVQRRVIIGDEMGLGKTIEALAVLAHLRSEGSQHALVICPAAVVTNWMREISRRSALSAHRLHGNERTNAVASWIHTGGVAVTTYESLRWLNSQPRGLPKLGCVVVDEAHYIKNPAAKRTQRTKKIIQSTDRTILLTGTPLENRVDEFRNLVGYVRPDLLVNATEFAPKRFRLQVAPAYLRRTQEAVLDELPELVQVEDWLPLTAEDRAAYRNALYWGNFMAARQAAMLQGTKSAKFQRLIEIVEEAEDNGRRVVVFSYFRRVLDQVAQAMPGRVLGPLTGSVSADKRQEMIDDFGAARGGAVLVAQIQAGGVGLNIQAASVVIICEPQLKPTTEWQAIARAHRLGQAQSVQVHRLLSEEGVDARLHQMLMRKRDIFLDFAHQSEFAEMATDASDASEAALGKDLIADERERLWPKADPSFFPPPGTSPTEATGYMGSGLSAAAESGLSPSKGLQPDSSPTRDLADSDLDHNTKPVLLPYVVFSATFPVLDETSDQRVVENLVCLVDVEGPITGDRLHEAYRDASGDLDGDETSQRLDRAIIRAEAMGLICSDSPLGAENLRPKTFRLPTQPEMLARELGPRALTHVPWAELEYHLPESAFDGEDVADQEAAQQTDDSVSQDPEHFEDEFVEEDETYFEGRETEFILGDYDH